MKTKPCPNCGSTTKRYFDPATGQCLRPEGCEARRCQRRLDEDKALHKDKPHTQCHATTGGRSILFCLLSQGHAGPHLHGTLEWGGRYEHPLAKALRLGEPATEECVIECRREEAPTV